MSSFLATRRWRRLRVIGLFALVIAASSLLLYELLSVKPRSPLIVIAPNLYPRPFSPLAWSKEDVASLMQLDRETFSVADLSEAWQSKGGRGIRLLEAELQALAQRPHLSKSIVFYFRTHAAVDGSGVPCLVFPDASACRSETWLPLADVFQLLKSDRFPQDVNKLVILDCNSILSNWNHGVLFNTFSSRLETVVRAADVPNLVVMTAAGPGEVSAVSHHLNRSVFGHFLRRGLAGEADLKTESGNGDRQISVAELHQYLTRQVNSFNQHVFGRAQHPIIIASQYRDFVIGTAVESKRGAQLNPLGKPELPSVSPEAIEALWQKFEKVLELEALRYEPMGWIDVGQQLVWLEMAVDSGEGLTKAAQLAHGRLLQKLDSALARHQKTEGTRSMPVRWRRCSDEEPFLIDASTKLYSLQLSEYFGTLPSDSIESARGNLSRFKQLPTAANLDEVLRLLTPIDENSVLKDVRYLQLLQRYRVPDRWVNSPALPAVLELHELADSASVPDDERVLEWIRAEVDLADSYLRKVDDQLFAGDEASSIDADIAAASKHYKKAIQIAESTSQAFLSRANAAYQLPYLAQWLTQPPLELTETNSVLPVVLPVLNRMIHNQFELEDRLSNPVPLTEGETISLPFNGVVVTLESDRDQLLKRLESEYERLLNLSVPDPVALSQMNNILAIPLLPRTGAFGGPAEQRTQLRDKSRKWEEKLVEKFRAIAQHGEKPHLPSEVISEATGGHGQRPEVETTADSASLRTIHYLENLLVGSPEHIANSIISQRDSTNSAPADRDLMAVADQQGHQFRGSLTLVHDTFAKHAEELMNVTDRTTVMSHRLSGWCMRNMAASDGLSKFEEDPIVWRRRQDLVRFLIWHAERVLEDFWGGSNGKFPFFATAVDGTLRLADAVTAKPMTISRIRAAEVRSRLERRVDAARRGLNAKADDLLLVTDDDSGTIKVDVSRTARDTDAFPPGKAAVFVGDVHDRLISEVKALPIPAPGTTSHLELRLADNTAGRKGYEPIATVSFRGNDFASEMLFKTAAGVTVETVPDSSTTSRITVRGRNKRKLSLLFILDCSASMQAPVPLENGGGTATRLDVAKLALQQMLEKLGEEGGNRVGVTLFGHRVGWNLNQPGELLKQIDYGPPIPDRVNPYDDVESILPLGRFDLQFASAVTKQLATVKPWGESPVYLGLLQALNQFHNEEPDVEKGIVIITDGVNYQFNPPQGARKTLNDVLLAWNENPVPIHIVGLGISPDQSQEAQRVFGSLAEKSGGSYVTASESQKLIEALDALRRPKTFRVVDVASREAISEVSRPVVVEPRPDSLEPFVVTFSDAMETLALDGGEAIELLPTRDGKSFETTGYGTGFAQFYPLLDDASNESTDYVLGVHRPLRTGNHVRFDLSIQSTRRRFIPRPNEVWVEISPVVPSGEVSETTYVFYDANYLPDTSVPVLRLSAGQWPANSNRARIRAWFKNTSTPPTKIVPWQAVEKGDRNPEFRLSEVPEIAVRIRIRPETPSQILVIEEHSADSPGISELKVEFASNRKANRIIHRFDAANRIVTHRFQMPTDAMDDIRTGEIRVTTVRTLKAGTLHTTDSILVDTVESADVIEQSSSK